MTKLTDGKKRKRRGDEELTADTYMSAPSSEGDNNND